jgi:hypothetical protein
VADQEPDMTKNPDQDTIQSIFDTVLLEVGTIVDEDFDGCPGTVPKLTKAMEKELEEIEHHLNRLFSLARSAAP